MNAIGLEHRVGAVIPIAPSRPALAAVAAPTRAAAPRSTCDGFEAVGPSRHGPVAAGAEPESVCVHVDPFGVEPDLPGLDGLIGRPPVLDDGSLPAASVVALHAMQVRLAAGLEANLERIRIASGSAGLGLPTDDRGETALGLLPARQLGQRMSRAASSGKGDPQTWLPPPATLRFAMAGMDVHAWVQAVLRECYLAQSQVLSDYAQKVRYFNELKRQIRDELTRARKQATAWASGEAGGSYDPVTFYTGTYLGPDTPVRSAPVATQGSGPAEQPEPSPTEIARIPPTSAEFAADYDGVDKVQVFADHAEGFVAAILQQLPNDPELRAALAAQWEADGLTYALVCGESDGQDNWYATGKRGVTCTRDANLNDHLFEDLAQYIQAPKKQPGESLEDYVKRAVESVVRAFAREVKRQENAINVESLDFRAIVPQFTRVSADGQTGQMSSESGNPTAGASAITSKADLDTYIRDLEEKLNSVGDDSQLANVDLQAALQRQQQTLQTLSNMSKVLHETALAIVRKIGS